MSSWDNATTKKLKALTGKGLSASEIGKRLGISKNAVIGKLNRLGWNPKASAAADAPKKAKTTSASSAKKPAAKSASSATKKAAVKKTTATAKKAPAKSATTKSTAKKAPTPKKPAPKAPTKKAAATTKAPKVTAQKETAPKKAAANDKKGLNKNLAMHQRIIQHSLEMANLKPNQCRWPIGDPDSENFHFCGETVFVGKPYCYEHCKQAYQFTPPKKK